jgi:HTH-type transcriptional regulator / antitoxin HigA
MGSKDRVPAPGEYIRDEMKARGWVQEDLARILGRPLPTINRILNGKHAIMPEMAIALSEALGVAAQVWMVREAEYRLSLATSGGEGVQCRARLYDLAPVKEMERRGWIKQSDDPEEITAELKRFFEVQDLDVPPEIVVNTKKTGRETPLGPEQRAWCFRARKLARGVAAARFTSDSLKKCVAELRRLAVWPEGCKKVASVLSAMGIRFVVVEPLPRSQVDGAAIWLDDNEPVIVVSLRYDRIDSFWHTLGHELSHITHRDGFEVDANLVGEDRPTPAEQSAVERRSDQEAASLLIDASEIDDFITRVGPLYSRARINQFANRIRVHPGIIVGQLQHRGELKYSMMRDALVKVREIIVAEALTDGWGQMVHEKE